MKKYRLITFIAIFIFAGAVAGCGGTQNQTDNGDSAASFAMMGSDTMVNMSAALAENYMEEHPEIEISITGGGSGTGISALINGEVDIANSSRDIREEELSTAESKGIDIIEVAIGLDGLAVIVNDSIPVEDLTVDEIGRVFRGDITNWSELGGPDKQISLYGRQSTSGTYVFFRDYVLEGEYSDRMNSMTGNAQILEAVKADTSGIGYVGIAYTVENGAVTSGINVVNVAADGETGYYTPLQLENVETGAYPLARPLYLYLDKEHSQAINSYIKWILSSEGQEIILQEGFYPISPELQEANKQASF